MGFRKPLLDGAQIPTLRDNITTSSARVGLGQACPSFRPLPLQSQEDRTLALAYVKAGVFIAARGGWAVPTFREDIVTSSPRVGCFPRLLQRLSSKPGEAGRNPALREDVVTGRALLHPHSFCEGSESSRKLRWGSESDWNKILGTFRGCVTQNHYITSGSLGSGTFCAMLLTLTYIHSWITYLLTF